MPTPTRFSKEDIGGEILPILTTGLYRETLDALREYIQNSIDANTKDIELIIDPTTITVSDSGHGMSPSEAKRAIRLGISDKNPTKNVGFRGIGIYSAFNLCNSLEIFTKKKGTHGSRLVFNFGDIRKELLREQERRKQGLGPKLYLEKLLESSVFVEDDQEAVISDHGTRLILSDLLPDSYRQLQDWERVVSYLQNVVPLPFNPEFRYGTTIQKKFEEEDYRVVPLTLQIGAKGGDLSALSQQSFCACGTISSEVLLYNKRQREVWLRLGMHKWAASYKGSRYQGAPAKKIRLFHWDT